MSLIPFRVPDLLTKFTTPREAGVTGDLALFSICARALKDCTELLEEKPAIRVIRHLPHVEACLEVDQLHFRQQSSWRP